MRALLFFIGILLLPAVHLLGIGVSIAPVSYQVEGESLLELNFQFDGKSLQYDTIFGGKEPSFRAAIEVTTLFRQGDSIIQFDRYKLNFSPDTQKRDFLDIRSYVLKAGKYSLEIEFIDANDPNNSYLHQEDLVIKEINDSNAAISGIKLLSRLGGSIDNADENFVKNGVIMEPLPHHFHNRSLNTLSCYLELYQLAAIDIKPLVLRTEIFSRKGKNWEEELTTYQKIESYSDVEPIAKKIDISTLPSNTYKLKISVIDGDKKEWLQTSTVFVQSNPEIDSQLKEKLLSGEIDNFFEKMDEEEIEYAIRAVAMKAGGDDQLTINNILNKEDYESMRDYLFRYWIDQDPIQPEAAFDRFMRLIDALDQKFYSAFRNGFETDRGMIYLRYGPPTRVITRENDQGAVPYEIWAYDRVDVNNQVDVKFVFYNPSLAGDSFILLHSNARNEVRNPQWLGEIYNVEDQMEGDNYLDARGVRDNFQREAGRIFNDN